jgi:hypothetical protein
MRFQALFPGLLCLALVGAFAPRADGASGQSASIRERAAIHAVIETQLAAWRAGDHSEAYALAAAGIRARYSLDAFVALVQRSYPEIAGNVRAELGAPVVDDTGARISVRVFAREDRSVNYRYLLVRENGAWRISGVIGETRPLNDV